jgi:hypothetical protein
MTRDRTIVVSIRHARRIERIIRDLPGILSGTSKDFKGIARGMRARIGWVWTSLVRQNFNDLARGEKGVDGTVWPPDSREYLAYVRPKVGRKRPMAGKKWPGGKDGFMTDKQLLRWRQEYSTNLSWLLKSYDLKTAKKISAAMATIRYKERGGRTKLWHPGFGGRIAGKDYMILVDRGILRNSITPGDISKADTPSSRYRPKKNQVFRDAPGSLVVGTDVPYAPKHHFGKRPLWPRDMPEDWMDILSASVSAGLSRLDEVLTQ